MSVTDLNEWKERGQRKWGPLANLSRVEAIFEACAYLEKAQKEPNRANVRGLIGGGSDRDIGPVIKLYKDLQASRQKEALQLVPDTVVHIIAVEVENQLQKIKAAYEEQVGEERAQFEAAADEIAVEMEKAEDEIDLLKRALADKDSYIRSLDDEIAEKDATITQLQEQLLALDGQYNTALRKNEELTAKVMEKDKTITANEEKHKDAIAVLKQEATAQRQELTAQHDKEIDRLMTQLGNERGEWRQEKNELKADITALQNALQERQKTVDSQSATIIQLNKEALNQNDEIARLKSLEEQHTTLQAQLRDLTTENRALQKDNQRLAQQLPKQQELLSQIAAIQKTLIALQDKTATNKRTTTKTKPKKGE